MPARVRLKPGRRKSLKNRHPWLFSGAIAEVDGEPESGAEVIVTDEHGTEVARGFYNAKSQIRVRVGSWDPKVELDTAWWQERLKRAIDARAALASRDDTNCYRFVHSEGDGLPGLVVDRYGDALVVQLSSLAAEVRRDAIVEMLVEQLAPQVIINRVDAEMQQKEGLTLDEGVLFGTAPSETGVVRELGIDYAVDLVAGSKTGFFVDQRDNRARARQYLASERVLDAFCFTGAFALHARAAGAGEIVLLDSSATSLALAQRNFELNGQSLEGVEAIADNAFERLRKFRDSRRTFTSIVLDPPKLAPSRSHVDKAARAYKDINLLAMKLLEPGGHLITFSCSGAISAVQLQTILFHATVDSGRQVSIIDRLGQGCDHPVPLTFPEADYLCGFILRVD